MDALLHARLQGKTGVRYLYPQAIDATLAAPHAPSRDDRIARETIKQSGAQQPEPELFQRTGIDKQIPEQDPLVSQLISFRITEQTAKELVRDYRKSVEIQLQALPHRNLAKIRDLASWLVVAVKENHELPQIVTNTLAKESDTKQAKADKEAEAARQHNEEQLRAAYFDYLKSRARQIEKKQPDVYKSFLEDSAAKRVALESDPANRGQVLKIYLRLFDDEQSHLESFRGYFKESGFKQWVEAPADE